MNRKRLFLIGVPLLLIVVIGAGLLWLHFSVSASSDSQGKVTITTTPSTVVLPGKDIARLEDALNSPSKQVQAAAFMPDLAQAYLGQSASIFPAGATLKILQNTSICKGVSCRVDAVVTKREGKETIFTLFLDDSTGQWLIAGTSQK